MANEIYNSSYWGNGVCDNAIDWGVVYKDFAGCTPSFTNTYSLAFDGVDDSIVLSNTIDLGINSSISVWVNLDSNYSGVLLGSESYDSDYFIQARYNNFFVRIASVFNSFPLTDNALTAGSWHNLVVTRSGDSISTYVDGNFIETKTGYGTSVTTKFDTIADRQTSSLPLEGKIDELSAFNTTLTSENVTSIYNSGVPNDLTSLNPLVWYRMGDNGSYKSPQWLIPNNSNKDKVSNFSFEFDGVDDKVDVGNPASLQITGDMTLSAWIKTSDASAYEFIIGKDDVGSNRSYGLLRVGNNLRFFIAKSGVISNVTGTSTINDGAWHHVLAVNDGTDLKVYVDGSLENTNSGGGGAIDNDASNFNIGARASIAGFAGYWTGSIDEVAVWNSDQSSNVASIYNSGVPTTITGAVAHWKMGEEATFSTNWTVPDQVGSNNGTSANMTIEDRVGNASNSTSNAVSFNMTESDRETDVPS